MVVVSAIGSGAAGSERVKAQYARLSGRNGGVARQNGRLRWDYSAIPLGLELADLIESRFSEEKTMLVIRAG